MLCLHAVQYSILQETQLDKAGRKNVKALIKSIIIETTNLTTVITIRSRIYKVNPYLSNGLIHRYQLISVPGDICFCFFQLVEVMIKILVSK